MHKFIAALSVAAATIGCAPMPPPQTLSAGGEPTAQELAEAIHARLKSTLKDYDSMKDFSLVDGPASAYAIYGAGGIENLWFACVKYNAKNSYGGYTGLNSHPMYFRRIEGEVVHIAPIAWKSVSKTC